MEAFHLTKVTLGHIIWINGVYWAVGLLFLYTDLTKKPKWMLKYKTQPGKNEPVDINKVKQVIKTIWINQIYAVPFIAEFYILMDWRGAGLDLSMPSVFRFIWDFIMFNITNEIAFYYTHRLLHVPSLYKSIHKQHHQWVAPIGIAAEYAHPFEYVFSNILPMAVGPLLCGSNLMTTWIWWGLGMAVTVAHHSGYHLPYLPSPEFHDYHHLTFSDNFGVMGILDSFHGTDKSWKKSKQFKRHKTIYSPEEMMDNEE